MSDNNKVTTIVMNVADALFDPALLAKEYTWSGKSQSGEKIAFKNFENIIKMFHAVVGQYVVNIPLKTVGDSLYMKVLKHSKARSNRSNTRACAARASVSKRNRQHFVLNPHPNEQHDDEVNADGYFEEDEVTIKNENESDDDDRTDDEERDDFVPLKKRKTN